VSVIAAIQYALFKDPNHPVFGNTDAAKCTAAIRLPDNSQNSWADKGWWAEAWSNWTGGQASASGSPGGSISYDFGGRVQLNGSTQDNGRSTLRDNGNHVNPFGNVSLRQSQQFGILVETRLRVNSLLTSGMVFVGMMRPHETESTLDGIERMLGIVSGSATGNWRAISIRNYTPSDGITPAETMFDTSLGIASNVSNFMNCVVEVSGEGKSARWRTSTGAWTNNKIPVVHTATSSQILSRPNEGPVTFGVEVREWAGGSPTDPTSVVVSRLNIWAWRPGYVATRPVFRFN
jgi:hypothetical protein